MAKKLQQSPSQTFPGINRENFWYLILLKQGGRFPWTENDMKNRFYVIKEHLEYKSNWNSEQLADIASFVLDHINKFSNDNSIHTREFSTATDEEEQPDRCSTPKALRTCDNCDEYLKDSNLSQLCPDCHHIFKL